MRGVIVFTDNDRAIEEIVHDTVARVAVEGDNSDARIAETYLARTAGRTMDQWLDLAASGELADGPLVFSFDDEDEV